MPLDARPPMERIISNLFRITGQPFPITFYLEKSLNYSPTPFDKEPKKLAIVRQFFYVPKYCREFVNDNVNSFNLKILYRKTNVCKNMMKIGI